MESPDCATGLEKVISSWLKRNYDTDSHGPPTWKMLVEAVRAPNGGNNTTLADQIAKAHLQASNVSSMMKFKKTEVFQHFREQLLL